MPSKASIKSRACQYNGGLLVRLRSRGWRRKSVSSPKLPVMSFVLLYECISSWRPKVVSLVGVRYMYSLMSLVMLFDIDSITFWTVSCERRPEKA